MWECRRTSYRWDVCTHFLFASNSERVVQQTSTNPRGHSRRGYGDNGAGRRPSIENVQLVVRSNGGVTVRHARNNNEKEKKKKKR